MPFVLPTVVVGVAFRTLLAPAGPLGFLGLDGSAVGILAALIFFNLAVVVRTVGGLWEHLDPRREQAAAALGATPWQVLRTVTLPALAPAVVVTRLRVRGGGAAGGGDIEGEAVAGRVVVGDGADGAVKPLPNLGGERPGEGDDVSVAALGAVEPGLLERRRLVRRAQVETLGRRRVPAAIAARPRSPTMTLFENVRFILLSSAFQIILLPCANRIIGRAE